MAADPDWNKSPLPVYAGMLADYHQAFCGELRQVVARLPVAPGATAVDLACGDGSYTRWLAERVGPAGRVLAADLSPAFLLQAKAAQREAPTAPRVKLVRMDVDHSPLAEGIADLVWCAQSLYSLPDPVEVVRRMGRLARPGGCVAVFESDEFHHILLPWPVDLEMSLRRAELEAFEARSDRPKKYYVARSLTRVFREAGLPGCSIQAFAACRQAPFDPATKSFLTAYLERLRERTSPYLSAGDRSRVAELTDPGSPRFMLDDADASAVCVDHLATATRPET